MKVDREILCISCNTVIDAEQVRLQNGTNYLLCPECHCDICKEEYNDKN